MDLDIQIQYNAAYMDGTTKSLCFKHAIAACVANPTLDINTEVLVDTMDDDSDDSQFGMRVTRCEVCKPYTKLIDE